MGSMIRVLAAAAVWSFAAGATAGIVKGPYLQDARTDRITVVCETDTAESCTVRWGEGLVNETAMTATAAGIHHEAVIEGLGASTCYPYRLACGAESAPQASFCAAPTAAEPFSFVLFGDTRSNHDVHRAMIERIMTEGVDFYINTGDLVSSGELEEDWVHFFDVEGELLCTTPLYPVVGNHDEDDGDLGVYERLFALPQESSGRESYYAFSYGNARFLAVDNQASSLWQWFLDTQQKNWLLGELDAAAADPDIQHVFVLVHENMYSSKDGRTGDLMLRSLRDDLKAKGVNAVFAGHDHYYERGEADNGLVYVISGGGGAGLYDTENPTEGTPVEISFPVHTIHYSRKVNHYLRIDIQGGYFHARVKDAAGFQFDEFRYGEQPQTDGGVPDAGRDAGGDPGPDAGDAGLDAGSDAGVDAGADPGGCDCSAEPYDPVCGEDGTTYDNLCELDCAQVGLDHDGPCDDDPACESRCPSTEQPVCGTDGVTYTNMCFLECAGAGLDHQGACDQPDCASCPPDDDPVCGSDGRTYRNSCVMECMGATLDHTGPCEQQQEPGAKDGCGCGGPQSPGAGAGWLLLLVLLAAVRRGATVTAANQVPNGPRGP